ncbi:MAG: hemerythrin domain-containing protein [Pseudomonadota bacterium]|nr:hemerythrin domain-containing protein [Pseudomonadota bacterium]
MSDDLKLDAREGLPADLRVLVEEFPREMWEGHANFQGLTAFWLQMHGKFRSVQTELLRLTQDYLDGKADPMKFGSATSRYTGFFLEGLHGHHGIEDHHYFPIMAQMDDRVARAFDLLDADHHVLTDHMNALADATNAVLRPLQDGKDIRDPVGKLHGVQSGFQTFLDRHLTDEEDVVVPLILKYGDNFH